VTASQPAPPLSALARLGFEQPEAVRVDLERLGAWPPSAAPGGRRLLRELAASAAPGLAARSLARIAEAHPDPDGFAALLRRRPGFRRRLVALVAASRSLGAWLAAHPEEADRLADGRHVARPRPRRELAAEAVATVAGQAHPGRAWEELRRFKRRELLRVAVRDLAGGEAVEQVGVELAALAEACLEAALVLAAGEAGVRLAGAGEPPGQPPALRLAVLGMGKLGGGELNYVSDIDVLFCHEPAAGADPQVAGGAAERVLRELLAGLGAVTPEGTCFRVDANLRPEGRNGPLSRTLGSYLAYWDRWAQPWELQALIKVRPVAGDPELAGRFCAEAARRVYPERLEAATVSAVRRMKARVEAERLPAGADPRLHLKLGPGGLADVEWTAQLLQLRFGGRLPAVRVAGTLPALAALAEAGALEADEASWLADAYRLCLRTRNLAYLVAGRAVESLPADPVALERLARAMGEPGRQRLLERYRRATRRARRVVMARFWEDAG
jgi:[glutamine synthetase] adenylyltransferase / [glutamine synthetase]-adenylyl-L-tyrosine phosphorylase